MSIPTVSVIIPVYNAQETIDKCLESLLNQTYQDYEIILINDGSKDDSLSLLWQYEQDYDNITVISKENTGASDSRNQGIKASQGSYLLFIDSDDYVDADYIETFVSSIEETDLDMVIGGIRQVDDQGKKLGEIALGRSDWAKYIITSPCTRIIRRSFLLEQDLFFINYTMEDIHFNAVFFSKTSNIKTIPYVGYNNFVNPVSTTRTLHKGIRPEIDILYILEAIRKEAIADDYIKFFYQKVAQYYLLHTGRHSSPKLFLQEHRRIKEWMVKHHLDDVISPFDSRLSEERLKTRVIMAIFRALDKVKLLPLFAACYCQG